MVNESKQYDVILDAREDRCPMPLLKAKMALSKMEVGGLLSISTCDSGSLKDIPQYVSLMGFTLLSLTTDNGVFTFEIKK
ncbi:sulfurtransferase TusA family protein [Marinomonas sp. C1424]|uniref:Sulfurtransferase TusA family protein n=2 Tax=Marinomonas transparens TaxID=2795388 RepID=A0A934JT50_9GAMM|nr:sulfurtransferase TusA family protein [Marinomonas transparens]